MYDNIILDLLEYCQPITQESLENLIKNLMVDFTIRFVFDKFNNEFELCVSENKEFKLLSTSLLNIVENLSLLESLHDDIDKTLLKLLDEKQITKTDDKFTRIKS
jgi:hypothetical protein